MKEHGSRVVRIENPVLWARSVHRRLNTSNGGMGFGLLLFLSLPSLYFFFHSSALARQRWVLSNRYEVRILDRSALAAALLLLRPNSLLGRGYLGWLYLSCRVFVPIAQDHGPRGLSSTGFTTPSSDRHSAQYLRDLDQRLAAAVPYSRPFRVLCAYLCFRSLRRLRSDHGSPAIVRMRRRH
jgi:hypothetical protein